MFVPIHDSNPLRLIRFQIVTAFIVLLNFTVFLTMHYAIGGGGENVMATALGMIPAVLTGKAVLRDAIPAPLTLITYMFVHAGWLHIISNMLFLWVFADNVEDAFGHVGFMAFYLGCGILAGLAHLAVHPGSDVALIGASGAVSGVLAAYLVLFPHARVWVLLFLKFPVRISAFWALLGWIVFQVINMLTDIEKEIAVAWWAHIGGFISGLVLTTLFRRRLLARLDAL